MSVGSWRAKAEAWMASDPDPETVAATQRLLEAGDEAALEDHFGTELAFGTAGLRGQMGPGPNRMNRANVRRVTAGLAAYLLGEVPDAAVRGVVVAFDARRNSRVFAEDTARTLAVAGLRVFLCDDVEPTPFLGYAVIQLGACAGVVVTASHNPPADNGYKVFWGNGAQIIPPHDSGIAACVARAEVAADLPALASLTEHVVAVPGEMRERYLSDILALRVHHSTGARLVYTAMHGVGTPLILEALNRAGHTDVHLVAEQCTPDGSFPTVAFPNPEEPGALDLAKALAARVGADAVFASDPDADRLAVAIPDAQGVWHQLTGNQVGLLLAEDLLQHGDAGGATRLVANSIVSSTMLERIAAAHGARFEATLTGFKWIADAALRAADEGDAFIFGFEEALGYSVGPVVRDKDGVSAALVMADLVAWAKSRGETLWDRLDALYRQHGVFLSRQKSLTLPGADGRARIAQLMATLRESPPSSLAGRAVVRWRDLLEGTARQADGSVERVALPKSNVLAFDLSDGSRMLARPSGTEPKIKFYVEAREEVGEDGVQAAVGRASVLADALLQDLLTPVGIEP